ncbi:MAG: sulfotransferase family protein [Proteobacteria bacterium]|nr:sulfotransferase family protein [Pseudomonadota bacterium]
MRFEKKIRLACQAEKLIKIYIINKWYRLFCSNPYHSYLDESKTIFIHVPKCAGMSVQKNIYGVMDPLGHKSTINYQFFDNHKFKTYFKFTFVRNPWDRFLSAYYFLKKGGISKADAAFSARYVQPYDSFSSFVRSLVNEGVRANVLDWIHFRPQYLFLIDCSMSINMDFIGRVENFSHDLRQIMIFIGRDITNIEVVNRTEHPNKHDIYGEVEKDIVRNLYARDIELFGYEY